MGGTMEHEMFTKIDENHAACFTGFEVKWSARDAITYIEPPRHMEFYLEGYWDDKGTWQHEIIMPSEPKWRPPYHTEPLAWNHLTSIKTNLINALQFLYPGVPFDFRDDFNR